MELGLKQNYSQRISYFDAHLIFPFLNLPITIPPLQKKKKKFNFYSLTSSPPLPKTSPGDT